LSNKVLIKQYINKYSVYDLLCNIIKNGKVPASSDMNHKRSLWHQLDLASCEFHS